MQVALLVTCVVDALAPEVGEASVRVLRAGGCDVDVPAGQTCCGQPAWNSGFAPEAARVASSTLAALETALDEGAEVVAVPAGSCATMVRVFWPELFEVTGDHAAAERARRVGARVRELTELLAELDLPALAEVGRLQGRTVAYHHSCHMLRELRLHDPPLQALAAIPGCRPVPWEAEERCCGFGGLFSVKLPEVSVAMADDKLASLADVGADVVAGADSSCLLHLGGRARHRGGPVEVCHVVELLDAALAAADHEAPAP